MKKKIFALLCITAFVLTGCGSGGDKSSSYYTEESVIDSYDDYDASGFTSEYEGKAETPASAGASSIVDDSATVNQNRKIIYTASINIETKNFDEDVNAVKELITKYNGYYEDRYVSGGYEYGGRNTSYTIRIPVEKYSDFITSIGSVGSVTTLNESANDVTSTYVDVETRISSLNTKLERLLELEEKAETVTDLLEIEDRINETMYELESYQAQLNTLKDRISYCTINLDINEVEVYTPTKEDTFLSRVGEAFSDAWSGFVSFLQGFVIVFIYLLPYIILVVIILFILLKLKKKRKAKKAKLSEAALADEKEKNVE